MKEFRKTHQFMVFASNTPVQYALAEFLKDASNYSGLEAWFQAKRDAFAGLISGSRFGLTPAKGTYFQLLDYGKISEDDEMDFATYLVETHKVAAIPNSAFYAKPVNNKTLRFCFAKSDETLEKAAEILCKI